MSSEFPELTERQQYWLTHLRAAEQLGERLKHCAKRLGLASSSMREAKRRLRELGVLARRRYTLNLKSSFKLDLKRRTSGGVT
jgi:hypothetical protein